PLPDRDRRLRARARGPESLPAPEPAEDRPLSAAATETALAIDAAQREVLLEELATLVVSLRDPETRDPWESLAAAVDAGGVEEGQLGRLEQILEMTLQTGRVRRVHGAE